jgi:hypothetical protein
VPRHLVFSSMQETLLIHARHLLGTHFSAAAPVAGIISGGDGGISHTCHQQRGGPPRTLTNNTNGGEGAATMTMDDSSSTNAAILSLLPPGLNQELIKSNFAQTISVVRISPTMGTFALGADNILRFHSEGALADLPHGSIIVRFDPRQYPSGNAENLIWTIKLFNIAVIVGAMELLVAVNTYQRRNDGGGDGGGGDGPQRETKFYAFARIETAAFTNLIRKQVISQKLMPIPAPISAVFEANGMTSADVNKHIALFPLTTGSLTHYLTLDLRKLVHRTPPAIAGAAASAEGGAQVALFY